MSLQKLRVELEETIRQSRAMASAINSALTVLLKDETDLTAKRDEISNHIIIGLQAQDRLEQRCVNIERVLERLHYVAEESDETELAVWGSLSLDELAKPDIDGRKATEHSGEVELF